MVIIIGSPKPVIVSRASETHSGPAKIYFGWPDWPAREKVKHDPWTVNRVLRDRPPDISETETSLRRPQRTTLSQFRSGHCHLLNSYKHRIGWEDDPQCKDCGYDNQDVNHLFDCPAHPTVMSPTKLWSLPADTIGEFAYLDPERLD